jgi:hypothetical protein
MPDRAKSEILADAKWTLSEGMQRAFYEVFTAKQARAIAQAAAAN